MCGHIWINQFKLCCIYVIFTVRVSPGNLCVCVFRYRPTVKSTKWPTATWLWCLVPTCCGDKTTPWLWVRLGQSTTSPEPFWISIIWFFLEFRPVTLQSLFKCETRMHSWRLALSSIIMVLLFQQHTDMKITDTMDHFTVCLVSLLLPFMFWLLLICPEMVSVFSYHQKSI